MSNLSNLEAHFRLGVNYLPRHHGLRMWKEWRPDEIDGEFAEMKSIGLDVARIFMTWDDIQPMKEYLGGGAKCSMLAFAHDEKVTPKNNPCMVDPNFVKRFDELIRIAEKRGVDLEPVLITGWASGGFFDPPYRRDRNIYTDPLMLKWQNKLAQFFADKYKNEKRIAAWGLGNESNCMMDCPSQEAAWLWTANLARTLRLFDPNHSVISSMHGLRPVNDWNWTILDQADLCDILTVHPYPPFTPGCNLDGPTDLRTILHGAAEAALYQGLGKKPVLCEETGTLGVSRFSEEESAKFLRLRLYTLLAQGNLGCLWYCHSDFTCNHDFPYQSNMLETDCLGLFDGHGRAKPAAKEYQRFGRVLAAIGGKLPVTEKMAVIIVPERAVSWLPYFNSYLLCQQAGMAADFAWEYDDLSRYQLAICPAVTATARFRSDGWENLVSFARNGGVLYLSYDDGSLLNFGEVFGLKISHGQRRTAQNPVMGFDGRALYKGNAEWELDFSLTTGKPLLAYEDRKPCLIENSLGKGKTVFFAEPAEMSLAKTPHAYKNSGVHQIYDYLRNAAGIGEEIEINDPLVGQSLHFLDENRAFLVLVNYHREPVAVDIRSRRGIRKVESLTECFAIRGKMQNGVQGELAASDGAILEIGFNQ
ncbi:MAG: cellulase family glycosylhydrolase [Verrucomicrobiae bacterium]|nr:cellulase family glycosylhydrolase [Verrucomicrobiae bacterium]